MTSASWNWKCGLRGCLKLKKKRGNYENKCKLEKKIVDSAYNDDTNMLEESWTPKGLKHKM